MKTRTFTATYDIEAGDMMNCHPHCISVCVRSYKWMQSKSKAGKRWIRVFPSPSIEDRLVMKMADEIREEIDRQVIEDLLNAAAREMPPMPTGHPE